VTIETSTSSFSTAHEYMTSNNKFYHRWRLKTELFRRSYNAA